METEPKQKKNNHADVLIIFFGASIILGEPNMTIGIAVAAIATATTKKLVENKTSRSNRKNAMGAVGLLLTVLTACINPWLSVGIAITSALIVHGED